MSLRDAARRRFLIETGVFDSGMASSAWLDAAGPLDSAAAPRGVVRAHAVYPAMGERIGVLPITLDKIA